jgi:hypothetical protein
MDNVKFTIEKDELVIRVNLKNPGRPSSSGKTKLIGTTEGTVKIPGSLDGLAMGVNVWVPNK